MMSLLYAKKILQNDKTCKRHSDSHSTVSHYDREKLQKKKKSMSSICLSTVLSRVNPKPAPAASCWHVSEMWVPLPHTWNKESPFESTRAPKCAFTNFPMWPWYFLSFWTNARVTHLIQFLFLDLLKTLGFCYSHYNSLLVRHKLLFIHLSEDLRVSCTTSFQQTSVWALSPHSKQIKKIHLVSKSLVIIIWNHNSPLIHSQSSHEWSCIEETDLRYRQRNLYALWDAGNTSWDGVMDERCQDRTFLNI